MYLSVGICTWNRSQLLDQALSSFRELVVPSSLHWELLVVNNNSTDQTDEVIAGHEKHLPIRRLFEPNAGKSHALNLAVREAGGDYILWTDDDVLVDAMWLKGYADAFTRWPDSAIFGGPIRPWFPNTPPDWLQRVMPVVGNAYAVRDFKDFPLEVSGDRLPYGANLALRMKEQKRYAYDTDLGPRPGSALRGEEVALLLRMLEDGATGRWVPEAVVQHHIPVNRQSLRYLESYYRGAGEGNALRRQGPALSGGILHLGLRAVREELKYRIRRVTAEPETWIRHLIRANMTWGELAAARRDHRMGASERGPCAGCPVDQ